MNLDLGFSRFYLLPEFSRKTGGFIVVLALLLFVSACASTRPAPVIERTSAAKNSTLRSKAATKEGDWRPATYTVQKGDTLYSIALEHGLDYKEIAEWNNIDNSNVIRVGQQLKLKPSYQAAVISPLKYAVDSKGAGGEGTIKTQPKGVKVPYSDQAVAQAEIKAATAPANNHVVTAPDKPQAKAPDERKDNGQSGNDDDDQVDWGWPTQGKLIGHFNDSGGAKGLDISGKTGQSVFASAPGKVVYSGSGLRGYGKLIIIKHNKTYLSAYAHNSQILVKEGQSVMKGQKIAEMGDSDSDQIKLHFEIRRLGKPVDPMKYLPGEKSS